MRTNTRARALDVRTHEGAPAYPHMTAEQALSRSLMSCLLFEGEFYEDGVTIAERLADLAKQVPPETLSALAIEARSEHNLRHAPLLLLTILSETGAGIPGLVAHAIETVIQRPDELAELLSLYWNGARRPIAAQMKKGLGRAFRKFDEYQLAKYDRETEIKLRDVLFLSHATPKDAEQAALWKRLIDGELAVPNTWEVGLSSGQDKREVFEGLLRENKLGYLALLRNLRNMAQAGVDEELVRDAILARRGGAHRVLPFRYVAAARACPQFEPYLDAALSEAVSEAPLLAGKTIILVDVSASMHDPLSGKSDLTRMDAAATLASVVHGDLRVFSFSWDVKEVPPRRGMAGVEAIITSQRHAGTDIGSAVALANGLPHDRLIVVTDEQSHTRVPKPVAERAYMINVASAKNGIGYGKPWVHIDGFSEAVLRFLHEYETRYAA